MIYTTIMKVVCVDNNLVTILQANRIDSRQEPYRNRLYKTMGFCAYQVSQLIHVTLYVDDDKLDLEALSAALVEANNIRQANLKIESEFLSFDYAWSAQRASKVMQDMITNSKSLSALDETFRTATAHLTADLVVVLSRQFPGHPRRIIGAYRTVYIASDETDLKLVARHLVTALVYNVVREDVLRTVFAPLSDVERKRVSALGNFDSSKLLYVVD